MSKLSTFMDIQARLVALQIDQQNMAAAINAQAQKLTEQAEKIERLEHALQEKRSK